METQRKNILIIEDHDSIRHLLGAMLSKSYSVTTSKNGLEGLLWLGKGNIPDLILLDINMPDVDGFAFLEQMQRSRFFGQIPVMVISGNDDEREIRNCYDLGIKHFFRKPFNPLLLKERIGSLLSANHN